MIEQQIYNYSPQGTQKKTPNVILELQRPRPGPLLVSEI